MFDLLSPTHLKNSSSPLNLLRSSPCLPTILMIFLLAPFKRFSYFWTRDIPSLKLFTFFMSSFSFAFSSSDASRIDSCNSFLIISGVFFLFVFLTLPRNYKWKKVLKPFCRFANHSKSTRFSPSYITQKVKLSSAYDKNFWENLSKYLYVFSRFKPRAPISLHR